MIIKKFYLSIFHFIRCVLLVFGAVLSIAWLAPVPLSECGGYEGLRLVSTHCLLWGCSLVSVGLILVRIERVFSKTFPMRF